MRLSNWFAALILAVGSNYTSAAIIIDINESGSDLVAVFTGSIDLNAVTENGSSTFRMGIGSGIGIIAFAGAGTRYDLNFLSSDGVWGTGSIVSADSSSGDDMYFWVSGALLNLPFNYVSGTNVAGSMTFLAESLSSLRLNTGVYNYNFGFISGAQDSITVNVGQGQIPAPATLAIFGLGLAALGYRYRKHA